MIGELIFQLLTAGDDGERAKVYRKLERAGIDRQTADSMAAEYYKPEEVRADA